MIVGDPVEGVSYRSRQPLYFSVPTVTVEPSFPFDGLVERPRSTEWRGISPPTTGTHTSGIFDTQRNLGMEVFLGDLHGSSLES